MPVERVKTDRVPLLEARNIKRYFPFKNGLFAKVNGWIKSVDDVSFTIHSGETFGLVGESGCGKSTTAKLVLLIYELTGGSLYFEGKNIAQYSYAERQAYRASIQPVLQDPTGSLNPRLRIRNIISEPLTVSHGLNRRQVNERIAEVLTAVGLRPEHAKFFPHEFSGGQRQRIAIARALSTNPKLIILDEPISSLDVSIRAQVMNLLVGLQQKFDLSYLLIAHDLAVILHMSSKVGVMYVGRIIESAPSMDLYEHAAHPYTKALFAAAFPNYSENSEVLTLPGEVASPLHPPPGCRFHPRCPKAMAICKEIEPALKEIGQAHVVACHLYEGAMQTGTSGKPIRQDGAPVLGRVDYKQEGF
ncbi:MAG TPA: oligopeptide/dipeptide ABC transporter ATP-binding protein [Syntrophorhabdaceae bacterium]|nr:oligopeptide/dipeptide ABC transporter ATP-binding protein [Syntrophorhabdaceae bacterium]